MSAADRAIRFSTAAAVLGVAGIAAYVSYWHAFEVVRAHSESGITARLEPATIDGLVYSSSMVVLYAARHRLPVPGLARWLLALGILATLAANVAHGWSHGPVGAAVAAWPAASLVGSYELLLWLSAGAGQRAHRGRASPPGLPVPAGPSPARNRAASRRAPGWATSLIPAACTLAARSGPIAGLAGARDSTAGRTTKIPQRQPPDEMCLPWADGWRLSRDRVHRA